MIEEFDCGIIGGGPAGYTAGMYLASRGKKVVLFEKDKLGGTCLNKGCIPTKALMHISELYASMQNCEDYGIKPQSVELDFTRAMEKKNQTVDKIRKSLELAVKNSGVKVVYQEAFIRDGNIISTSEGEYKAGEIILAAGSKPREIKGLEFDGEFILSSDDILNLQKLPKSILIIGSGAIGIEWGRIFSNFGTEVSMVELAEHLIPLADIDVSARIERIFKQRKIKFYLNDYAEKIEGRTVTLKSGAVITPDIILSAAGRVPVCPKCGVNKVLGDACGEIQLAHYAIHQAKQYALNIPFDKSLVPSVIYGEPEIAWAGQREQDMDEGCKAYKLPVTALGKSWCDGATDGFIKIIEKDGFIKGAHIVSKEASSLIHTILTAMQNGVKISDLKQICFAHPTYSEGIFELIQKIN